MHVRRTATSTRLRSHPRFASRTAVAVLLTTVALLLGAVVCSSASAALMNLVAWYPYNATANAETSVDMAAAPDGKYVLVGNQNNDGVHTDIFVAKFSANLDKLWSHPWNSAVNGVDAAAAVAVDRFGNVLVTGTSYAKNGFGDIITLKYSSGGKLLWPRRFNGTGNATDLGYDVAADSAGNVYVTGMTGSKTNGPDLIVLKYSPSGALLWKAMYSGPLQDDGVALAVDGAGNAYVVGDAHSSKNGYDALTIKFNRNGVRKWAHRLNGPLNANEFGRAIGVNSKGVFVAASSQGSGTLVDVLVARYTVAGARLWTRRYDSPAHLNDIPNAMALDAAGNIYVAGTSAAVSPIIRALGLKWDATGHLKWAVLEWNKSQTRPEEYYAVVPSGTGGAYFAGWMQWAATGYDAWIDRYSALGAFESGLGKDGVAGGAADAIKCLVRRGGYVWAGGYQELANPDYEAVFYKISP